MVFITYNIPSLNYMLMSPNKMQLKSKMEIPWIFSVHPQIGDYNKNDTGSQRKLITCPTTADGKSTTVTILPYIHTHTHTKCITFMQNLFKGAYQLITQTLLCNWLHPYVHVLILANDFGRFYMSLHIFKCVATFFEHKQFCCNSSCLVLVLLLTQFCTRHELVSFTDIRN